MQECLNKGVDVNTTTAGNTCLHLAVFQPKPGLIKLLLEKGVDAELGNDRGNTALHIASRKGFADVILFLLEYGVDKDKKNKNEEPALYTAAELNHVQVTKQLLRFKASTTEKRKGFTPLLKAIKEQNNGVAELLIKQGANVNEQIGIGHATSSLVQNLPIFKQLLKNDLDINTNFISGETYLTTGIKLGNSDFTEFLIENGGPIIIDDNK